MVHLIFSLSYQSFKSNPTNQFCEEELEEEIGKEGNESFTYYGSLELPLKKLNLKMKNGNKQSLITKR